MSSYNTLNITRKAVALMTTWIIILVYMPALDNGFVNWDDDIYILENPYIQYLDIHSLKWMFTTFHSANWHPLTWLSHAIDYAIWGQNPMGHHLTSMVFHGVDTFLVVTIVFLLVHIGKTGFLPGEGRTTSIRNRTEGIKGNSRQTFYISLIAGTLTGLLFGLHPLHVESAVWVSERKDVLCAFFFLLSVFSYLKHASPSLSEEGIGKMINLRRRRIHYSTSLLFFILTLLSKPMAVTLPVVLMILDCYPLRRLDIKYLIPRLPLFSMKIEGQGGSKVLIEKVPFIVLSVATSIVTIVAQQTGGAIQSLDSHPLGDRLLVALKGIAFYLYKMIWPTGLVPLYPYPSNVSLFTFEYAGVSLVLAGIVFLCIYHWRGRRAWSAAWLYYLITLLPVLGIIQVGGQAAADRYTYLPGLGPFFLFSIGIAHVWEKSVKGHPSFSVTALVFTPVVLILALMTFTTVAQVKIWKDSLTLWNRELKIFPDYYRAFKKRGRAYTLQGNYQQAIADYHKAIELNPFYSKAYVDLGISHAKLGNYQKSLESFDMAITINPEDVNGYYNRGLYYANSGDYEKALKNFDTVIRLAPDNMMLNRKTYLKRGEVIARSGHYQEAIQNFSRLLNLHPRDAEAYNKRGMTHGMDGNYQKALQGLNAAITYNPGFIDAYNNRGNIYAIIGDYQKAFRDFDIAIKLNPESADIYVNRGTLNLNLGNNAQAIRDFQRAARLGDKKTQDYLKSKGISWQPPGP